VNCRDYIDFLDQWVARELDETQRAAFERHTADCPPCETYLHTYETTVRLGKSLCDDAGAPPPEMPERIVQAILAARAAARQRGDGNAPDSGGRGNG
jgi:anti-sigma factor RsiW